MLLSDALSLGLELAETVLHGCYVAVIDRQIQCSGDLGVELRELALELDRLGLRHPLAQLVERNLDRARRNLFVDRVPNRAHDSGLELRLRDARVIRAYLAPAVAVPGATPRGFAARERVEAAPAFAALEEAGEQPLARGRPPNGAPNDAPSPIALVQRIPSTACILRSVPELV